MRNISAILRRELLSLFVSPIAYFVIAGFVFLAAYFFFSLLGQFNWYLAQIAAMPQRQELPNLNEAVVEGYYHTLIFILVFFVPLITMRTMAEEKRRGTFELLITSPLKIHEIVLGKYLSVAFMVFIMSTIALVFPMLLWVFGQPGPEVPPILSGYLALTLCALAFVSLGMAVSSFTENQIVAGMCSLVLLLLLYVVHLPAESLEGAWSGVLKYLSPVLESRDMVRGVISTQGIVYFASLIAVGIFTSLRALEAHRWR